MKLVMQIIDARDLGAAIRAAREARGLTQEQVAAAMGVSHQWISEVERGKPNARLGAVLAIAQGLGLSLTLSE